MKKYKHGYTQGVYDMFHVGHLNLINNAKKQCEFLTVGVNADALVWEYKHKYPVVPQEERREIVDNIKAVDEAVIVYTLDKMEQLKNFGFDVIFIGDDWKGNPRWERTTIDLQKMDVDVVFLPYTNGVSSTILREVENNRVKESETI